MLADARGLQRVGFPFDHLTDRAPRARPRPPVSGRFEALSFVGEWRPVSARRAGGVREGPPARPHAHAHRRAARLGEDAARRRADPARRQARARARAQPGHPAAVAARGRRTSRARPRTWPAPTRSSRSPACPTRRCASSRIPEIVLGRLAQSRWADERAAATGMTREEVEREGEAFEGAAAQRRARELSRISAALKREVARGEHAGVELRDLLSATARERVQTLAKLGVGVVLLDECHHLASLWGYVVRAVLGELPEGVHVIGLTATPPVGLPGRRGRALRRAARPGRLHRPDAGRGPRRPSRALPGARVADRAAERRARLARRARHPLPRADHERCTTTRVPGVGLSRLRDRRRSADDDAELSWAEFQKRSPKLARAGIRFLLSGGLQPPHGRPARRGVPPAAGPRGLARAARGLRAALPRAAGLARGVGALRRDRRRAARARLPAHPPGRAAAARPRSTGC